MTNSSELVGVPADVAELWTFYATVKTHKPADLNLYGGKLIIRTQQYRDAGTYYIHNELAQHWVNFLTLEVLNAKKVSLPLSNITRFIDLLSAPGVVEKVSSQPANHAMLACVILQAVCEEAGGAPESFWFTVPTLLERWSGKEVSLHLAHTPVEVANFLYGPGVWDIYRNDVEDDDILPAHLFSLGVPLRGEVLRQLAASELAPVVLPGELT